MLFRIDFHNDMLLSVIKFGVTNIFTYFSDDLVQMCVDYMREYPLLVVLMVGIPLFLLLSFIYLMKPDSEPPRKKKKKKDKEKEKDKSKEKKEK